MMKKILYMLLVITLMLAVCLAIGGCDSNTPPTPTPDPNPNPAPDPTPDPIPEPDIPDIDLSGVEFHGGEFTYDGKEHSIEVTGSWRNIYVTVKYEGNGKTDVGTYPVVAKFYYKDVYLEGRDLTANMTIKRAQFDTSTVFFGNKVIYYDGNSHSLELVGALPEGITVKYEGNGKTEPGIYNVTASFEVTTENYYPIDPMKARLQIKNAVDGMAGVSMSDAVTVFDGETHSLAYSGTLGEGITLYEYTNNGNRDAGTYTVIARFARDGVYDSSLNMAVTHTIRPAKVNASVKDKTVKFDGERHSLELVWDGEPIEALEVVEIGNDVRAIGENKVVFKLVAAPGDEKNYENLYDIVGTLTIEPDLDWVSEGIVYRYYGGSYYVMGYEGDDKCVIIPDKYNGPDGNGRVVSIEAGAFRDCTSVEYVYIGENVYDIKSNAFRGCTALSEVSLGKSVATIGSLAFADTAVKNIVLPDSIVSIGFGILRNTAVEFIQVPFFGGSRNTSNAYLGYIFGASGYAGNGYYVPDTLKRVVVSDRCTYIPAYAMYGCASVIDVVIGSGVSEIGISAFAGCESISSLYIPDNVTEIPSSAHEYNSIVYGCADNLTITLEASAVPEGFGTYWNTISEGVSAELKHE